MTETDNIAQRLSHYQGTCETFNFIPQLLFTIKFGNTLLILFLARLPAFLTALASSSAEVMEGQETWEELSLIGSRQ